MENSSRSSLISIIRIRKLIIEILTFQTSSKDSKNQSKCIIDNLKILKSWVILNTILKSLDFLLEKWLIPSNDHLKNVWSKSNDIFLNFILKSWVFLLKNTRRWTHFWAGNIQLLMIFAPLKSFWLRLMRNWKNFKIDQTQSQN